MYQRRSGHTTREHLLDQRRSRSARTRGRTLAGAGLLLVTILFATACTRTVTAPIETGAGADTPATADPATGQPATGVQAPTPPARPSPIATQTSTTSAGNGSLAADATACPPEFIGSGSYVVVNIPANDPDGGLVGHSAPGVASPITTVYPPDFAVWVDGTAASCHVVESGAVWWRVAFADAPPDWVNAFYLGFYEGPGDRPIIGTTEALCSAYWGVVEARETDIPVSQNLIRLDVELGGHPIGVSAAIFNLVNGISVNTDADNASIDGYVGPICNGGAGPDTTSSPDTGITGTGAVALDDAQYAVAAESCIYYGDGAACALLESAGYSVNDNYGLGNSIGQTPFWAAIEECRGGEVAFRGLYCADLYSRINDVNATAYGGDRWLAMCGQLGLNITQFEPTWLDLNLAEALLLDGGPLGQALGILQSNPDDAQAYATVSEGMSALCGDYFFND